MTRLLCLSILLLCLSCKEGANPRMLEIVKKKEFEPKEEVTENIGRSSWQKPDLVIDQMGDITNMTIADIGAGTGYFSYRLAFKGARVVAIDVDPDMIDLMAGFKSNLPAEVAQQIETRLAKTDDPLLADEEVDAAIIINTIAYIDDKTAYLTKLKAGLSRFVMIVDYKVMELGIPAPPLHERIPSSELRMHLIAAGYKDVTIDDTSLDYQYMVKAWK